MSVQQLFQMYGATLAVASIATGIRLGLFAAMQKLGRPIDAASLARECSLNERVVLEWCCHLASAGVLKWKPGANGIEFSLPASVATVLLDSSCPQYAGPFAPLSMRNVAVSLSPEFDR
jgi:hypothetical protein